MKIAYPGINDVFELNSSEINSIVIENPKLFYEFVLDIKNQTNNMDGSTVVSINNEPQEISKKVELITDVFSIDINSKTIVSRVTDQLCKRAMDVDSFEKTTRLMSAVQEYLSDISWDMECDIAWNDVIIKQIIKAVGFSIEHISDDIAQQIYQYCEIVREFIGDRLFIFVNIRGFLSDTQMKNFAETLINHQFMVLLIDNKEYTLVPNENRRIIDIDLCEI